MRNITIEELTTLTGGKLVKKEGCQSVGSVSTDSRTCEKGDVFFAIVGEFNDAHRFIGQVVERGCDTVVISEAAAAEGLAGCNIIMAEDTTVALQKMAADYLKELGIEKRIAVTGSVGKTSTRDMAYYIMSEKYYTGRPESNLNSDVGVPLAIFSFNEKMEAAVLETGMDTKGEIHRLENIVRPDVGIITNVGISHIERLGSREAILKEKLCITDFFGPDNTLVINGDNDMLSSCEIKGDFHIVRVGTGEDCDYIISDIKDFGEKGISFCLTHDGAKHEIKLGIPGAHNAMNASLAVAACACFGVTIEEAVRGLGKIRLTENRLAVHEVCGIKVIDDTYNAAPDSMKSAIMTLVNTKGKRKIAILGGMNELGPDSQKYHVEIGRFAGENKVDLVIAMGPKSDKVAEGAREVMPSDSVLYFADKNEFYPLIHETLREGDVVLVKASRSMELETVVDKIIVEQEKK